MTEVLKVGGAMLGGFALGAFFFLGLWWTVRGGLISTHPAVVFLGSMAGRTLLVLVGFYFLSRGNWRNLVGSLIGFVLARLLVTRSTRLLRRRRRGAIERGPMNLTSDQLIFWQHGFFKLNETIITTWFLMLLMVLSAMLITRRLATEGTISRWQGAFEIITTMLESQIKEVGLQEAGKYLPFLGTLFVFVPLRALCIIIPGYKPPTGSLSTTAALALCVFFAVPLYGIREQGLSGYLKTYTQPTFIMLPFNIISELSRTLALAVRLFGNMMSGVMIVGILLTITPFLFPIVMTALGLLTGMVQAYIFTIVAGVYIAAATSVPKRQSSAAPASKPTS